jgi:protein-tyrosine-phosphatase
MKSILFVCTGNVCRSPMAEALLRHMLEKAHIPDIHVFSRGVSATDGNAMTREALQTLAAQGVDGKSHRAVRLSADDILQADVILVMEQAHAQHIRRYFPQAAKKTFLLKEYAGDAGDIDDPFGQSLEAYEKCKIEIQDSLLAILSTLNNSGRSAP